MLLIPLIYFILTTIYFYRVHGHLNLDVAASFVLAAISFFAILIDVNDLYGKYGINEDSVNLFTVLLYCLQWTLVLIPLHILSSIPLRQHESLKKPLLYGLTIVIIIASIVMIANSITDIRDALIMDMIDNYKSNAALRSIGGQEEKSSFVIFIASIFISSPFPTLALFLWFYLTAFRSGNVVLRIGLLGASIVQAVLSIIVAGRAALIYWLLEFFLFYCYFSQYFSARIRRTITIASLAIGSVIIGLLFSITMSRFGDDSGDKTNDPLMSLYGYAGQQVNNFSTMIMEGADAPFQITRILPFSGRVLTGQHFDLIEHYEKIHAAVNIQANVFSTFGGEVYLDLGAFGYIMMLLLLVLVSLKLKVSWEELSFHRVFAFVIIVTFFSRGLFAWPFVGQTCTFALVFFVMFHILFKYEYKV